MFYLFVFLKLPIVAACVLVWWAVRQEPDPADDAPEDGGGPPGPGRHPRPPLPRAPRRSPHREHEPASPPRVRRARSGARRRERQL